eukprot:2906867-Pleurochrysis_carterae.AAC.2
MPLDANNGTAPQSTNAFVPAASTSTSAAIVVASPASVASDDESHPKRRLLLRINVRGVLQDLATQVDAACSQLMAVWKSSAETTRELDCLRDEIHINTRAPARGGLVHAGT